MDEKKEVDFQAVEAAMQGIFEQLDMKDIPPEPLNEWLGEFMEFIGDKPKSYALENVLVAQFLIELSSPYATATQWLIGRILINKPFQPMIRDPDAKGRTGQVN